MVAWKWWVRGSREPCAGVGGNVRRTLSVLWEGGQSLLPKMRGGHVLQPAWRAPRGTWALHTPDPLMSTPPPAPPTMTEEYEKSKGLLSILRTSANTATKNNKHVETNYTSEQICFSLLD